MPSKPSTPSPNTVLPQPALPPPALQWPHAVASVGVRGVSVDREATALERAQLCSALDILALDAFEARYTITPQSGGRFEMVGEFTASLQQACGVTLEPVRQNIKETLAVTLCPPSRTPRAPSHVTPSQVTPTAEQAHDQERSVLGEPDTEHLTGDMIEAGQILYELLSAAIDPYPRKAEVDFSWQDPKAAADDTAILHPFAALAKLKKDN